MKRYVIKSTADSLGYFVRIGSCQGQPMAIFSKDPKVYKTYPTYASADLMREKWTNTGVGMVATVEEAPDAN